MNYDLLSTKCRNHTKRDGSWWEKDARGIELARVCDDCIKERLSGYNPGCLTREQQDIIGHHSSATYEETCDGEQIEAEPCYEPDEGSYFGDDY